MACHEPAAGLADVTTKLGPVEAMSGSKAHLHQVWRCQRDYSGHLSLRRKALGYLAKWFDQALGTAAPAD